MACDQSLPHGLTVAFIAGWQAKHSGTVPFVLLTMCGPDQLYVNGAVPLVTFAVSVCVCVPPSSGAQIDGTAGTVHAGLG